MESQFIQKYSEEGVPLQWHKPRNAQEALASMVRTKALVREYHKTKSEAIKEALKLRGIDLA